MPQSQAVRPIDLPSSLMSRFLTTFGRALRRRCPYCGGGDIFTSYFNLRERCPHCHTLFAYEDGYFLGAYAINVVAMMFIGLALVFGLIVLTDLTVVQMQILGVILVIGLPILLYPVAMMLWMALDVTVHPPGDFSGRPRQ